MVIYNEDYWQDVAKVVKVIPNRDKLFGQVVFISGATGLICSAVVELLYWMNQHFDANIHILLAGRDKEKMNVRFPFIKGDDHYSFIKYDATSAESVNATPDYIIHGASNADPVSILKQPVETMLANIIGTKTLLDLTVYSHAKRFLLISSSEIYGKKDGNKPYREKDYGYVDLLNPRASYPSSKRAAETLCSSYAVEYGIDTVVIRPGHIYGPGISVSDSRASAEFTRKAKAGEHIVMKSAGAQFRSYCHALDCASAILTVLINGEGGAAYNISSKNIVVRIRDIAEAFAMAGGVDIVYESPSIKEQMGFNFMDNSSLDGTKLEAIGWKVILDVKEGTRKTIKHYC